MSASDELLFPLSLESGARDTGNHSSKIPSNLEIKENFGERLEAIHISRFRNLDIIFSFFVILFSEVKESENKIHIRRT